MDDSIKILAGNRKSINAVQDDKYLNVNITRNISPLIDSSTVGTLDLNERFLFEREECKDYRLILTVNPYCTNVLFNPCTEIIKHEGSSDVRVVTEQNPSSSAQDPDISSASGKRNGLTPYYMIRNTEYSKDKFGYEYHPGMDFFNNHILRNKTYRIVNRLPNNTNEDTFNTIEDYMRTQSGEEVEKCTRNSERDTLLQSKHLYNMEDVFSFENNDATTENLREENGWFGFYNTNTIPSKNAEGHDMNISRALNNKSNCGFVDMYPDRTLFSFIPKYNKYRNRLESNWDFQITYPYEHCTTYTVQTMVGEETKDFKLVQDGSTNALLIVSAEYVMGPQGENYLLFRTATKHNLKVDDYIHLYYNEDEENGHWHPMENETKEECRVVGIGNLNAEYQDYYFYLSDTSILDTIFATPKEHDGDNYTAWDYVKDYFYEPLVLDDIEYFNSNQEYIQGNLVRNNDAIHICTYDYMPTDTFADCFDVFPDGDNNSYVQYYSDTYGLTNIPSQNERYIAKDGVFYELYNHDLQTPYHTATVDANQFIRQIINSAFKTGDDDADITPSQGGGLWRDYISFRFTRSNGASECSYYVRKFKKVPNMKYGTNQQREKVDFNFENEQYPLAFSQTIYGDGIAQAVFTDNINVEGLTDGMGNKLTDIYVTIVKTNRGHDEWYTQQRYDSENVEFSHCFGPVTCGFKLFHLPDDSRNLLDKMWELGDVNLIHNDASGIHQTLGDKTDITINDEWFYGDVVEVCPWRCEVTPLCDVNFRFNTMQREMEPNSEYIVKYDEITSDDLLGNFHVDTREAPSTVTHRIEGYYYKPHYRLRLKGYGSVHQATHKVVDVYKAEPIQANGIFIKIQTRLKHNVTGGRILLRDRASGDEWWLDVVTVLDAYNFVINKISRNEPSARYRDWIMICDGINNGQYVVRRENLEIPSYATKTGTATYIWRDVVNAWDVDNTDETLPTYTFANGCFYIDESINFFLNRQDMFGKYGLYYNDFLPDPKSEVNTEQSIYEYKDESVTTC